MKPRGEFLLHLFDKLWDDINTNVKAIWLLITILLLGSFATVIFTKANVVPMITTYSLVIVSIVWVMAHIISAGHWFQSSLSIISNIEKQFLNDGDHELVHLYFAKHRPTKIIPHFWLQQVFLVILAAFLLIFYSSKIPYTVIFYNHTFSLYLIFYLIPFFITIAGSIFLVRFKKIAFNHENLKTLNNNPISRTLDWFDTGLYMLILFLLVMVIFFYTAHFIGQFNIQAEKRKPAPIYVLPKKEELVLNGVMLSEQSRIALINHKIFRIGDKIQGMRVVKIAFNGVMLQDENQTVVLHTSSY